MIRKKIFYFIIIFSLFSFLSADSNLKNKNKQKQKEKNKIQETHKDKSRDWRQTNLSVHDEVAILKKAYPDVEFIIDYDEEQKDYTVEVKNKNRTSVYYWCEGLYLPKDQLVNKNQYYRIITYYDNKLEDPANFSQEKIDSIKKFSSRENRSTGSFSSKFIFDAIYDASSRLRTEQNLKQIKFLDRYMTVHKKIIPALERVETKIYELSKTNQDVKNFLADLSVCQAYNWREIRDARTRSFHSYGIAVDILPYKWGKKIIYWGFEKNEGNDDWMLIPLEKRWMPPQAVITAFEEEGFIWGGYWAIWDNMHFEYHPELILAKTQIEKSL